MIYYFTGNGNSRWVAEKIAEATDDEVKDLSVYIRENKVPEDTEQLDRFGIVFPIHSWYAPRPVVDMLERIILSKNCYRYAICTCGDDAGKCMQRLRHHFKFNMAWSVRMPNTYIPMFDLDTDTIARLKIKTALEDIEDIANAVSQKKKVRSVFEGAFPYTKTYIINPIFVKYIISTKGFHLDDECVSCGTCRDVCPVGNIRLIDGRPQWSDHCIHCMACVHACPHGIIQYKDATHKRGRYRLKRYL